MASPRAVVVSPAVNPGISSGLSFGGGLLLVTCLAEQLDLHRPVLGQFCEQLQLRMGDDEPHQVRPSQRVGRLFRHMAQRHIRPYANHEGRYPKTLFRVTAEGKKHFLKYLEELERLIHDALPARSASTTTSPLPGWIPGWT